MRSIHIKKDKKLQKAFGYTYEDVMTSILPMAKNGTESIAAMGTDSPLAVLSKEPQPLFQLLQTALCTGYKPAD